MSNSKTTHLALTSPNMYSPCCLIFEDQFMQRKHQMEWNVSHEDIAIGRQHDRWLKITRVPVYHWILVHGQAESFPLPDYTVLPTVPLTCFAPGTCRLSSALISSVRLKILKRTDLGKKSWLEDSAEKKSSQSALHTARLFSLANQRSPEGEEDSYL